MIERSFIHDFLKYFGKQGKREIGRELLKSLSSPALKIRIALGIFKSSGSNKMHQGEDDQDFLKWSLSYNN